MIPKDRFWEEFGYKTAKKVASGSNKQENKIQSLPTATKYDGDTEGGNNEGADIPIAGTDIEVPNNVPKDHWSDFEGLKDDLAIVVDLLELLKLADAAKKTAEDEVADLRKQVATLNARSDNSDRLRDERDWWKARYLAEVDQVRKMFKGLREILPARLQQ